jgi:hypothetical protein
MTGRIIPSPPPGHTHPLPDAMYLVAIAWIYVVLMMAVAEAMSSQGSVLGGAITFVLYGVLPLGIVLYILGSPLRRRARLNAEHPTEVESVATPPGLPAFAPLNSGAAPDGRSLPTAGHAAGLLTAERKEV